MTELQPGTVRSRADFDDVDVYKVVRTLQELSERYAIPVSDWVKLNQNENPYGPIPAARDAVRDVELHRYPDSSNAALRQALAEYCEVSSDEIVVGNGGDEVIDALFRLLVDPGDEAITFPPTFGFYPVVSKLNRATLIEVPRDHQFRINVAGAKRAISSRTKLILLCSPNNPTGELTSDENLRELLEFGIPVMLDEAYVEFADKTALALQAQYPHLMIIRTFSKWAGLAGLRVGYGIFNAQLAAKVRAIRPAYTVNVAAEAAAVASLEHRASLLHTVERIRTNRDQLAAQLTQRPILHVWPSDANFLYCTSGNSCPISYLYEQFLQRGILLRLFTNPDAIRITVGTEEENARLLSALDDIGRNVSRETIADPTRIHDTVTSGDSKT